MSSFGFTRVGVVELVWVPVGVELVWVPVGVELVWVPVGVTGISSLLLGSVCVLELGWSSEGDCPAATRLSRFCASFFAYFLLIGEADFSVDNTDCPTAHEASAFALSPPAAERRCLGDDLPPVAGHLLLLRDIAHLLLADGILRTLHTIMHCEIRWNNSTNARIK